MSDRLRTSAWFLAVLAIMLRAALPSGWMPVADVSGAAALVICTGHGPLALPDHSHKQAPQPGHGNEICPFAAAAHFSPPAHFTHFPAPIPDTGEIDSARYGAIFLPAHFDGNYAPRGPPSLA